MSDKTTNTFTQMTRCTPVGKTAPACPAGWESSGFTSPGSCMIGNTPGDGPTDTWRGFGYQRVCKRTVPTTGDMAVDCCSNLYGIAGSLECSSSDFKPYSWKCNSVMADRCNSNVKKDPFRANWNGMPYGQNIAVRESCSSHVRGPYPDKQPGSMGTQTCSINGKIGGVVDQHCANYLRNAPSNNFFSTHDFSDVGYSFPRYSYTTPDFQDKTWGYSLMRKPYYAYDDYKHQKIQNNYCRQFPEQCGYGYGVNNYRI